MTVEDWHWHSGLYEGSAPYYPRGRVGYSSAVTETIADALGLDGSGRLLDVGCGPGSLTLLLAPLFSQATGVDVDEGMLAEAERQARIAGVDNVEWLHLRAEELPTDLGPFRTVTLAQAFHWMDRPLVAGLLRQVLADDGALVHVHAVTHQGVAGVDPLPHARPPWPLVDAVVRDFLGQQRRGALTQGAVASATTGQVEAPIYRGAGFSGPDRRVVPGVVVERSTDDVVAGVYSLSSSAPHLFGDRLPEFERELRALLAEAAPDGLFSERMLDTIVDVWRPAPR